MKADLKKYANYIISKPAFNNIILWIIITNSIVLGMQSSQYMMKKYGYLLIALDKTMICIFIAELTLYLIAYGPKKCFRDPWYLFDTFVIAISVFSFNSAYASLRAMRILRIFRLVSKFPNLRKVTEGLISAIPGILSIGTLLMILIYSFALMANNFFGAEYPENFGTLPKSVLTLFQMMITDGATDIIRTVLATHPYSWIFFILYMFLAAFVVLNLFVAVTVSALQKDAEAFLESNIEEQQDSFKDIKEQLARIEEKINKQ